MHVPTRKNICLLINIAMAIKVSFWLRMYYAHHNQKFQFSSYFLSSSECTFCMDFCVVLFNEYSYMYIYVHTCTCNNSSGLPIWEPSSDPFTIEIRDPERKKKYHGIKKFTAYSIIPSSTGRAVSRRFKHYDWLHDRLAEKFTVNSVPPLPDKQYYGVLCVKRLQMAALVSTECTCT